MSQPDPVAPAAPRPERGIWDDAPAADWEDGFLSGNGEYGVLVHGPAERERLVLTHHRFVLPNGTRDLPPPRLADRLDRVREAALAGRYDEANDVFRGDWELRWTQPFHPGYALCLATTPPDRPGGYARWTDFATGEVGTRRTGPEGAWRRRVFVSRPDRVVVHELTAPPGDALDLVLSADTALDGVPETVAFTVEAAAVAGEHWLTVRGDYPPGLGAFGFDGHTRVVAAGGSVAVAGDRLLVTGARRLLLLTALDRQERAEDRADPGPGHRLAAVPADYAALRARHVAVHGELFGRSRLELAVDPADRARPVGALLARQDATPDVLDPALLERLYDSGRYLLLSASGVLPPRLTGLWTGSWTAAWAGDFTTDANVNLQVAGGYPLDLAEPMAGYQALVLGQLDHWRANAAAVYGARGFLAPPRTDGESGHLLHFDRDYPLHCWTGAADWLLLPLYEHYQITGDRAFLAGTLGPVLLELALFYEDFLSHEDADGRLVLVPSYSVENHPASTGNALAVNATGDIAAARHALRAAIDAANALGLEQGPSEGVARWTALLDRLPAYRVNAAGGLAEWAWPGLTDQQDHRHLQHLYGAWPAHEINPEETPELVGPAVRALELRGDQNLSAHGSLHRALAAARLKRPELVAANLRKILGRRMFFRSLMSAHNPGLDTYNADAAHALPAVVAEALVYSRPGVLELLPALPDELARGRLTGLLARTGVRVHELTWDLPAGTATARLESRAEQPLTLLCRPGLAELETELPVAASPLGPHARRLTLPAGRSTTVTARW
ncbi:glycoside hydrolase N-terminal domain-containing protein [Streptomyces sp. DSM 44915]|uniref:Glycoside hydrolase N-terminal domain-containing protein n=1 Tax=Streptomyces chisholmiae TaxID=3075540 RepID=A0ABU2JVX7_9ACTN|nr:glycoside hydrolase N-terminal domain-containing protein [Streptomyces sp. DSM 44915]MDT0269148.1 glycoside hydrolase N-terminal domain-containing protein [Streptomyces sp. DSM 44915]